MRRLAALFLCFAALAGCKPVDRADLDRPETARDFPRPYRPVSDLGANRFSSETERDSVGEAQTVMDLAAIEPGMTVADIGAGEGYYTVRLAERVGAGGRVLAQDIDQDALGKLGLRVERERLDNVSIMRGAVDDPRLPKASFDRIFLVHMYHEVTEPYAFLWRLYPALTGNGRVIVVDVDRPTDEHGMPPELLFCEFKAVGFRLTDFVRKPAMQGYYAEFERMDERPSPASIKPCGQNDQKQAAT